MSQSARHRGFKELKSDEVVALIDGIFGNLARLFKTEQRGRGWGYHQEVDLAWVKTDPPSEYPNYICDARFTSGNANANIASLVSRIQAGELPPLWALGPCSTPNNLKSLLEQAGFVPFIRFPGMALDLQTIKDEAASRKLRLPDQEKHFEIRKVTTGIEFSDWINANLNGFYKQFQGSGCEESVYRHLLDNQAEDCLVRFYSAYYDDKCVGAAQANYYCTNKIPFMELHQCSVLPEYRKLGIARRLVSEPLVEGKRRGCVFASIFAAPEAADPFWTSMGFVSYCDLDWYLFTKPE